MNRKTQKRRSLERSQNPASSPHEEKIKKTKVRVVGVGGGAGNIVSEIATMVKGASFLVANTDKQALRRANKKAISFQFGDNFTQGLGTGMNPQLAELAALDAKEKIKKLLSGQDLVILIATLGGGTGTGASPVFAKISRSLGNHTIGIFTLPFAFEGEKKMEIALEALKKIKPQLNAYVLLPNERVFQFVEKTTPLTKAFLTINKILADSLEGLIETVFEPGLINIDFADLRTILSGRGRLAFLNTVQVSKLHNPGEQLVEKALNSPLFSYNIKGARAVLFNIAGQKDLELSEVSQISKAISDLAYKEAKIIFGISQNRHSSADLKITLLATGCSLKTRSVDKKKKRKIKAQKPKNPVLEKPVLEKSAVQKPKFVQPEKKPVSKVKAKPKRKKKKIKKVKAKSVNAQKEKNIQSKLEIPRQEVEEEKAGVLTSKTRAIVAGIRKNALQVREEIEREEARMLAQEKIWETPAFLRKKGEFES